MAYYLIRTAYGTEFLWRGVDGHQAALAAERALGLPVVDWRSVEHPTTLAEVA